MVNLKKLRSALKRGPSNKPAPAAAPTSSRELRSSSRGKSKSKTPEPPPPAPAPAPVMEDEDDDIYGSTNAGEASAVGSNAQPSSAATGTNGDKVMKEVAEGDDEDDDDDDEDEEDEDDSDDDIQIITERKPGEVSEAPAHNQRAPSAAVKIEAPASTTPSAAPQGNTPGPAAPIPLGRIASPAPGRPGSSYPEVKTSTLDIEANPTLSATGKPIFNTDMDADFPTDTAPWRRPGSDMTDYYNYGFDEGTWAAYCFKQRQIRGETAEDRKRMEQLGAMMGGSMPFGMMGGMDASAANMPMPNMEQMQQMMNMMGGGVMPGMPGMDGGMGQGQNTNFQNQGGYGGGGGRGGRGKRW